MSTILPHGIIQIDEGNTSWYNNITDNWQLIDSKIGEYDAAIATIPAAANDGVLTIKVNDTPAGAFSANQASNSTINVAVPTRTSQLTNDSDYITSDAVPRFATDGEIDALATDFNTLWGA